MNVPAKIKNTTIASRFSDEQLQLIKDTICKGSNDNELKLFAMHRWHEGGPHDDTVVVANFADRVRDDVRIGFPAPGRWRVRLNTDSAAYDLGFDGHEAFDTDADGEPMDGCDQSGLVSLGPYSVVVLSRED